MHIKEKLQTFCKVLAQHATLPLASVKDIEIVECGYKKGHTPPETGWQPLSVIQGADRHHWLRFSFRTPAAVPGSE